MTKPEKPEQPADADDGGTSEASDESAAGNVPSWEQMQQMPVHELAKLAGEEAPRFKLPPDPPLSRETIRRVEREAIEQWGIPSRLLMESAGRMTAEAIRKAVLANQPTGQQALVQRGSVERYICEQLQGYGVLVVAGAGNNGGDGFVVARYLQSLGADVIVWLLPPRDQIREGSDPAENLALLERLGVPVLELSDTEAVKSQEEMIRNADVIVDAMFGTGLSRELGEPYRSAISMINDAYLLGKLNVAVDIPSGLDADTGEIHGIAVRAGLTCTFAAMKKAFATELGRFYGGQVELIDIGLPRDLVADALHAGLNPQMGP